MFRHQLKTKKKVTSYKSLGTYIREVYRRNKNYLEERLVDEILPFVDMDHPELGKLSKYETFKRKVKETFKYDSDIQQKLQEALDSKNPKLAIKGVWKEAVEKVRRSTLITPNGKAFEEQILDEFWDSATKSEKSKFTKKKRKESGDSSAEVKAEDMEYLGYDEEDVYFLFEGEYLVTASRNPSPKKNSSSKYKIYFDINEASKKVKELKKWQKQKILEKNNKILHGVS